MSSKIVAIELSIYETRAFIDLMGDISCNKTYVLNGICVGIHVVQVQCNPGVPVVIRKLLLCLGAKGYKMFYTVRCKSFCNCSTEKNVEV